MRVALADLKSHDGLVVKDTVAGGYGLRFRPFSKTTWLVHRLKGRYHALPSIQLGYAAAILAQAGHEVVATRGEPVEADVAIVLSSLVDYRRETRWADFMRRHGVCTGFIGLAASKMPQLFEAHADFVVQGELESAIARLARGEELRGRCASEPTADLDSLPMPRWDLMLGSAAARQPRLPMLASRGCPEFCTYCPHRILASHRARSVGNVVRELEYLSAQYDSPHIVFRDPLFTANRDWCVAFCDTLRERGLKLTFACETRLDELDDELLGRLHEVGLRTISFGVESADPTVLRRSGRRMIPKAHQLAMMSRCRELHVDTVAFYVLGLPSDTWQSIAATIDLSISLGTTVASFKICTPYPGTPLWKQMEPLVFETDWEKFDGFTPTFRHPNLSPEELHFLLGAAYSRFYVRPSFLLSVLHVNDDRIHRLVRRIDTRISDALSRKEIAKMSRPVTC